MNGRSCPTAEVEGPDARGGQALTIGVPRAFHYFTHPRLWVRFFSELGLRTVVSRPSNRTTVESAARISEAEHCLPNKLFDAHLVELGAVADLVFVPRVLSTVNGHLSCPKLAALPDAARVLLAGQRAEVLCVDVDESRRPLAASLRELGHRLGADPEHARAAAEAAVCAMHAGTGARRKGAVAGRSSGPVLILGHPYTIHDQYIAGPIVGKLERMGVPVELMSFVNAEVEESFVKWDTCNKMLHRLQGLTAEACRGVVQITSFNCGCDSMMIEFYRSIMRDKGIPYMVVMVDEHSAQGGLETRLEAFVDTTAGVAAAGRSAAAATGW